MPSVLLGVLLKVTDKQADDTYFLMCYRKKIFRQFIWCLVNFIRKQILFSVIVFGQSGQGL